MSWPAGARLDGSTVPLRGSWIGPPGWLRCTIGWTPAPGASGLVSTWAIRPTVGPVPGSVAVT